jgi:hypothetical protein
MVHGRPHILGGLLNFGQLIRFLLQNRTFFFEAFESLRLFDKKILQSLDFSCERGLSIHQTLQFLNLILHVTINSNQKSASTGTRTRVANLEG